MADLLDVVDDLFKYPQIPVSGVQNFYSVNRNKGDAFWGFMHDGVLLRNN
jgi:hypothetical protein